MLPGEIPQKESDSANDISLFLFRATLRCSQTYPWQFDEWSIMYFSATLIAGFMLLHVIFLGSKEKDLSWKKELPCNVIVTRSLLGVECIRWWGISLALSISSRRLIKYDQWGRWWLTWSCHSTLRAAFNTCCIYVLYPITLGIHIHPSQLVKAPTFCLIAHV